MAAFNSIVSLVIFSFLVTLTYQLRLPLDQEPPPTQASPKNQWSELDPNEDPTCDEYEEWSWCLAHCQKNCSNHNKPVPCRKLCVPGCVCQKGFVRGPDDKCIEPSSCPAGSQQMQMQTWEAQEECDDEENQGGCYKRCQESCKNSDESVQCLRTCSVACINDGLKSPDGSCKDGSSRCIAQNAVPFQSKVDNDDCPEHEHSDWCNAHCQKDCTNYDEDISCPQICVPGCVCDDGYVRGHDGSCILVDSCPSKAEENTGRSCPRKEHYSECAAHPECQKSCDNPNADLVCETVCTPGCVCDPGHVRHPNGKCVPIHRCPSNNDLHSLLDNSERCGAHEEFSQCGAYYLCQRHCSDGDSPIACPQICHPGCVCEEGYVRGMFGKCVKASECPVELNSVRGNFGKCGDHEKFSRCNGFPQCQRRCSDRDSPVPCPLICYPGCICEEGYVKGPDGKCVRASECPKEMESVDDNSSKCEENEEFSDCDAHPACQRHCSDEDKPIVCPKICYPGCVCQKGYVKGPDGRCVESLECPREMEAFGDLLPIPIICKRDEVFSVCVSSCPDDCDNYKDPSRSCNKLCLPGCTCKSGTIRGPDGKCIRPNMCPSDKKPEDCTELEYYDTCGTDCADNCTNYGNQDRQCNKRCVVGCFCLPGYVRGPRGDCIFPFECPASSPSQIIWGANKLSPELNSRSQIYPSSHQEMYPSQLDTSSEQEGSPQIIWGTSGLSPELNSRSQIHPSSHQEMYPSQVDTSSEQEDLAESTQFRELCPDEDACSAECQHRGRRYGVCEGPRRRNCVCY